jgi:hypothetical protein
MTHANPFIEDAFAQRYVLLDQERHATKHAFMAATDSSERAARIESSAPNLKI